MRLLVTEIRATPLFRDAPGSCQIELASLGSDPDHATRRQSPDSRQGKLAETSSSSSTTGPPTCNPATGQVVAELAPGDFFGDIALIGDPPTATVAPPRRSDRHRHRPPLQFRNAAATVPRDRLYHPLDGLCERLASRRQAHRSGLSSLRRSGRRAAHPTCSILATWVP